jgi:hypothetical protein
MPKKLLLMKKQKPQAKAAKKAAKKPRRAATESKRQPMPTGGININISNVLNAIKSKSEAKSESNKDKKQAPDLIRPLGKRPIEASAFDNQYRLLGSNVTYASTPLKDMPSLRDIAFPPPVPQVSGQPPAMRRDIVPVETNPYDIVPAKGNVLRAAASRPVPGLVESRAATPLPMFSPQSMAQQIANVQFARARAFSAQPLRPSLPAVTEAAMATSASPAPSKAPSPMIAQRLEPPQADASQLLVANAVPRQSSPAVPTSPRSRLPTPPRSRLPTPPRATAPARKILGIQKVTKKKEAAAASTLGIDA